MLRVHLANLITQSENQWLLTNKMVTDYYELPYSTNSLLTNSPTAV